MSGRQHPEMLYNKRINSLELSRIIPRGVVRSRECTTIDDTFRCECSLIVVTFSNKTWSLIVTAVGAWTPKHQLTTRQIHESAHAGPPWPFLNETTRKMMGKLTRRPFNSQRSISHPSRKHHLIFHSRRGIQAREMTSRAKMIRVD